MHKPKYQTSVWFCTRSTGNDDSLGLCALPAPVSLYQSIRRVVAYQSSTAKVELRAGAVLSAAPGWQCTHWTVPGSRITLFIVVLVRGSVLKLALKLYNVPWCGPLYWTGNEAYLQWLHLVCIFYMTAENQT